VEWPKFRPRETKTISLEIPTDTLRSLKRVADQRDLSLLGLLKFYIGQSLRQDVAQILDTEADPKTEHGQIDTKGTVRNP